MPAMMPGLRAAEQLVAAEADDVHARGDALRDDRLVAQRGRQRLASGLPRAASRGPPRAASRGLPEPAAAEILRDRDLEAPSERDQLLERRTLGEAFDLEVRRMDAQDQRRSDR